MKLYANDEITRFDGTVPDKRFHVSTEGRKKMRKKPWMASAG
jgi:hypothetical protein